MQAQPPQLNQETQPAPDAAPAGSPQDAPKNDAPKHDAPQNTAPPSPAAGPAQPGAEPQSEPASPPETKPETAPEPQKAQTEPAAKKPESKASKKAPRKKRHRKTCAPPVAASDKSDKTVVRNGGTVDPVVQLAPGMSAEQASSQRQSTTQLLSATDDNLKQIASRQLSSAQQDSVSQIRKYMEQANAAEEGGGRATRTQSRVESSTAVG